MDPYEEYMRSLRPDLYPQTTLQAMPGIPTGQTSTLSKIGTGVNIAGDVVGGAASLYATYKALEAAQEEQKHLRQREQQGDYLATQDRAERRRQTGRNEMMDSANYSGGFMDDLNRLYKSYNGGYFNLHGA